MQCPFKPTRGRIVTEGTRLVPKSKSIIHVPAGQLSKFYLRVVAVGPGKLDANGKEIKPLVKVGDIVTLGIAEPPPIPFPNLDKPGDDKNYCIFDEVSVLAIVDPKMLMDGTESSIVLGHAGN